MGTCLINKTWLLTLEFASAYCLTLQGVLLNSRLKHVLKRRRYDRSNETCKQIKRTENNKGERKKIENLVFFSADGFCLVILLNLNFWKIYERTQEIYEVILKLFIINY